MNLFEKGGSDENQITKDLLQIPNVLITTKGAKKIQEAFNGLMKEFI